ncbi:MAG: protein rep [Actinomycetota bacterium]
MTAVLDQASTPGVDVEASATAATEAAIVRKNRYRTATKVRQLNRFLFPDARVGTCGKRRRRTATLQRNNYGRVSWTGIETCGSVWACPICAAKVRAARGEEVRYYMEHHLDQGGYVTLITLTTSHSWSDALTDVYDDVQKAWAKMTSGRAWQRFKDKYEILGPIVATEVTCGVHGWHPHLHVLLFHRKPMGRQGTDTDMAAELAHRWTYMVDKHTDREALGRIGCDVMPISGEAGIAGYLNKIHLEVTRGDLKQGRYGSRSAWQIGADAAATGEAQDIARWAEYVRATRGRKMMRISAELVAWYGKPLTADCSDEALAALAQDGPAVLHFTGELYDLLLSSRDALGAELPIAFELGGLPAVLNLLRQRLSRRCAVCAWAWADVDPHTGVADERAPLIGLALEQL